MQKIQGAKVLLSGLQGLGAEVAKNLVLMGVGSLTLHDPYPTCWSDLAAQVRVCGHWGEAMGSQTKDQETSPCSSQTLSLSSFSSQSRTWKEAGLRHLKNLWLSSTELSRFASTQVTSLRSCCWTSRYPPCPTVQLSPVPSSSPELSSSSGPADDGVHPGSGADYLEAGGAAEGGRFMP